MAGAPWKPCASMSSARCEQRLRLALFLMPGTGYNGLGWVRRLLTLLWTIDIGFFFTASRRGWHLLKCGSGWGVGPKWGHPG